MADNRRVVMLLAQQVLETHSDSEESSSSEDEILIVYGLRKRRDVPRVKNYREETVRAMLDTDFRSHFRISRESVEGLGRMIIHDPEFDEARRLPAFDLFKEILVTLWLLATPDSYRSVGDRFDVGKSVVLVFSRRVSCATAKLSQRLISWPNLAKMRQTEVDFKRMAGFPGVIGCIDGTHIQIKGPQEYPDVYINRDNYHSIILQGVVNSRLEFIDCYVGEVGSVHDARVFAKSNLGQTFRSRVLEDFHLLGDKAYPLHRLLLTPFRDNGHLTRQQVKYNEKLSKTRQTVERAFGLLKGKFRRLIKCEMSDTHWIPTLIMACCVLHNIARRENRNENEEEFYVPPRKSNSNPSSNSDSDDDEPARRIPSEGGIQKRIRIMNSL
ncbi:putative nuclease HARBI1 [Uloborus diversus]|uniref:putative nuclease HARBI1 n=1 Tax=Uloborus diversus TaxID=327109 RepID=UPI00240973DC|nr:putative nuclease HARBI1 [Uloborus diversus]